MQCKSIIFFLGNDIHESALLISFMFEAPVESIIGFLNLDIYSMNGLLVISDDDILKTSTKLFNSFADSKSNGVHKKSIFLFLQCNCKVLKFLYVNLSYFLNNSYWDFIFSF